MSGIVMIELTTDTRNSSEIVQKVRSRIDSPYSVTKLYDNRRIWVWYWRNKRRSVHRILLDHRIPRIYLGNNGTLVRVVAIYTNLRCFLCLRHYTVADRAMRSGIKK
jgi:hypothetical protein